MFLIYDWYECVWAEQYQGNRRRLQQLLKIIENNLPKWPKFGFWGRLPVLRCWPFRLCSSQRHSHLLRIVITSFSQSKECLVLIYRPSKRFPHFWVLVPMLNLWRLQQNFEVIKHRVNINRFENNFIWWFLSSSRTNSSGRSKEILNFEKMRTTLTVSVANMKWTAHSGFYQHSRRVDVMSLVKAGEMMDITSLTWRWQNPLLWI